MHIAKFNIVSAAALHTLLLQRVMSARFHDVRVESAIHLIATKSRHRSKWGLGPITDISTARLVRTPWGPTKPASAMSWMKLRHCTISCPAQAA
jgi:hypothetical protein